MLCKKVFCSANSVDLDEHCIFSASGSASVDLLHVHWVSMHGMHSWQSLRARMPHSSHIWRSVSALYVHRLDVARLLHAFTWKHLELIRTQHWRWSRRLLTRFVELLDGLRRSRVLQGSLSLLDPVVRRVIGLGGVLA